MKTDNQHLEFLISQYVDGCLEGANKKTVEQHLLTDPAARDLYTEHREVQDLLDDWGNRIPLIDWERFDQTIAGRLEKECSAGSPSFVRRWLRPAAAAAALLLAAGLGYLWHGWSSPAAQTIVADAKSEIIVPRRVVQILDGGTGTQASHVRFTVEESAGQNLDNSMLGLAATISPPSDSAAAESLKESLRFGLGNLAPSAQPQAPVANTVAAVPATRKETAEPLPAYP